MNFGNIVKQNSIGIRMQKFFNGSIEFTGNIICDNSTYNLELLDFNNANIEFNCWCSEDSAFIRSTIFDGYVNTNVGLVNYMPLDSDCPQINVGVNSRVDAEISLITIYPNPVFNELTVKVSSSEEVEFSIYSLNGQRILSQDVVEYVNLSIGYLPSGVYIYELKEKKRILEIGRIVKVE